MWEGWFLKRGWGSMETKKKRRRVEKVGEVKTSTTKKNTFTRFQSFFLCVAGSSINSLESLRCLVVARDKEFN